MRAFIFAILILFNTANAFGAEVFKLTSADNQEHRRAKAMNELVTECLNRLGIEVQIMPMPSKRSLVAANSGKYDGNFLRTMGISETYPNLLVVPEPISLNRIMAFSKDSSIKVNGWKSLLPYRVAWVRGWRNCERELSEAREVYVLSDEFKMFQFLNKSRADLAVFGLNTGTQVLEELGITDIKPIYPPIVESDLFIYVHKKHKDKIPQIINMLQEMKQDGSYQKIIDKYYGAKPQ